MEDKHNQTLPQADSLRLKNITLREDAADKRKENYLEKGKRLELEAAERRAAMQDDAYTDHGEK